MKIGITTNPCAISFLWLISKGVRWLPFLSGNLKLKLPKPFLQIIDTFLRRTGSKQNLLPIEAWIGPIPVLSVGPADDRNLYRIFLKLGHYLSPNVFCFVDTNHASEILPLHTATGNYSAYFFHCQRDGSIDNVNLFEQSGIEAKGALHNSNLPKVSEKTGSQALTLDDFFKNRLTKGDARKAFLSFTAGDVTQDVLNGADAILGLTQVIFIKLENTKFLKYEKDCAAAIERLGNLGFHPMAREHQNAGRQLNILFVHEDISNNYQIEKWRNDPDLAGIFLPVAKRAVVGSKNKLSKQFKSVEGWLQSDIPALVPCFNNKTYSKAMIAQLRHFGFDNIVLIDNASTSSDMLKWLDSIKDDVKIVRLSQNHGPHHIVLNEKLLSLLPRRFCLTDPDLLFHRFLPYNFLEELTHLTEKYKVGKAGFALQISDWTNMVDRKFQIVNKHYHIWEWEKQFWQKPLGELPSGDQYYFASIGTTFALYDQKYYKPSTRSKCIRVAGRYTARHLPWYKMSNVPEKEKVDYMETQKYSNYLRPI